MAELGTGEQEVKEPNKKIVEVLGKIGDVFTQNEVTVPKETRGIAEGQQPLGLNDTIAVLKALSWETVEGTDGRVKAIAEDGTVWIADMCKQPNLLQVSAWHWPSGNNAEDELVGEVGLTVNRCVPWVGQYDMTPFQATAYIDEGPVHTEYGWKELKMITG